MLAQGARPWIAAPAAATGISVLLYRFTGYPVFLYTGGACALITLFFTAFLRDPPREVKVCKNCLISPADGKVTDIRDRTFCIFMNLHNNHVNRAPVCGTVISVKHKNGSFLPAFSKDSWRNERTEILMRTASGEIMITQIAGIFARRIVSYVKEGDEVMQGERIGMIRFGSRVDVTIPEKFDILCKRGDKVLAGQTQIARLKDSQRE
jgi:phosphatidylserine decarboxylase